MAAQWAVAASRMCIIEHVFSFSTLSWFYSEMCVLRDLKVVYADNAVLSHYTGTTSLLRKKFVGRFSALIRTSG